MKVFLYTAIKTLNAVIIIFLLSVNGLRAENNKLAPNSLLLMRQLNRLHLNEKKENYLIYGEVKKTPYHLIVKNSQRYYDNVIMPYKLYDMFDFANDTLKPYKSKSIKSLNKCFETAEKALRLHLSINKNKFGLPLSFLPVKNYKYFPFYADRSYIFDLGSLLSYTAYEKNKWMNLIIPLIRILIKFQDNNGFWGNYFDNIGKTSNVKLGPSIVLSSGLLAWGFDKTAVKIIHFLENNESSKIRIGNGYLIKQNIYSKNSHASPEENARLAIFLIELYQYYKKINLTHLAIKYLREGEKVLSALVYYKDMIYPFGFDEKGIPIWEMPDSEGVEGEAIIIKALYNYMQLQEKDTDENCFKILKKVYMENHEVLDWIERTHAIKDIAIKDSCGKSIYITLGFSKKITNGNASPHIWLEFMGEMAFIYKYIFNDDVKYYKLIESMSSLQQSTAFLPYVVSFDGYLKKPHWPDVNDKEILNFPFGSVISTIKLLEILKKKNNNILERYEKRKFEKKYAGISKINHLNTNNSNILTSISVINNYGNKCYQ